MAFYGQGSSASYSSLPAGLEIAVAPNYVLSPSKRKSSYARKALPPIPFLPVKYSREDLEQTSPSNSPEINTRQLPSMLSIAKRGRDRRGSIAKIESLLGIGLDLVTRQPTVEPARYTTHGGPPQLPEIAELPKLDLSLDNVGTFPDFSRYLRCESERSSRKASTSSQDSVVEDIVDTYSRWGSLAPNPETPNSPTKHSLYLQSSIYSASAAELGHAARTSNARQPSRASLDGAEILPTITIADLIAEERERLGGRGPYDRSRHNRGDEIALFHEQISMEANKFERLPWDMDDMRRGSLTPQPLTLRPKRALRNSPRSLSRWSSHSSNDGENSGARDSVISHIRNLSSPFKVPSRPSKVFKEKTGATSTIQIPSPPEFSTRKRSFSSGRHPLKSPFPFRSPLHKKVNQGGSSTLGRSTFLPDTFKDFSDTRYAEFTTTRVLSNQARSGDGPDTPMPLTPGRMDIMTPTTALWHKGTAQIQGAVQKAMHVAHIRSEDERRRDELRKKIVVVGLPDSPSSWT